MCGICGVYGFEDRELVQGMCDVIVHRGPDDEGFYTDSDVGLGMRHLSIMKIFNQHAVKETQ